MQLKWLMNLDSNLRLISGNADNILAIPSQREFNYDITNYNDYKYFSYAFPNSLQNETIILKSFIAIGVSIAPSLKELFPNNIYYIQMQHIAHCNTIEDLAEFAVQNPEFYSMADSLANILATDRDKRYKYLEYFSKGDNVVDNKIKIQQDEYNQCITIENYVSYIDKFVRDDIANLIPKAKESIIKSMQAKLDNCKTRVDYENFIDKFINQKYGSNAIIADAKEKEFKQAYNECKTDDDYEEYITVYMKSKYSKDLTLITKAKENAYQLAFESCSTPEQYDWFVNEYEHKGYSSDRSLIDKAKLNAYQIRFDNCTSQSDFEDFICLYESNNYDPNKLIPKANKKSKNLNLKNMSKTLRTVQTVTITITLPVIMKVMTRKN